MPALRPFRWLFLALSAVAVVSLTACGQGSSAGGPGAKVTITSPAPNAEVPQKQSVSGTATDIPSDRVLWIFTRSGKQLAPQDDVIKVKPDNTWTGTAYVGSDSGDDAGATFDIVIYLVPKDASPSITDYLKTAAQTGKYPGMTPPDGSTELAMIPVVKTT